MMGVVEAPTKHGSRKLSVHGNCSSSKGDLLLYQTSRLLGSAEGSCQLRSRAAQGGGEVVLQHRLQILQQDSMSKSRNLLLLTHLSGWRAACGKQSCPGYYNEQIRGKPALAQHSPSSHIHFLFIFSSSSCIPICIPVSKMLKQNKTQYPLAQQPQRARHLATAAGQTPQEEACL